MERREALEKLYEKAFHPDVYNKTYYGRLDEEVKFFMHNLHDFFSKSKIDSSKQSCLTVRDSCEKRVLEIGTGPTVISMISASNWCSNILASDFLKCNRERISQWLQNDPTQRDIWLPFFQFAAQLENSEAGVLMGRVRSSVQDVVACNVFDADVGIGDAQFDVIISTLCLEFAAIDLDEYESAVRNVAALLRPSAYLILQGALGNTHYMLSNGQRFPSLCLNRKDVESALASAGCILVSWKELARRCPPQDKPADHSAIFFCLARKISADPITLVARKSPVA